MISNIATFLPSGRLDNDELARQLGRWTPDEIFAKTGIRTRCIAEPGQTAVDLAAAAVDSLRARCDISKIDFLLLCTQTADFKLPSSACILQAKAGLPTTVGSLDINLACSGFIYGLSLAEGLLANGSATRVLLVNSDTYTRLLHPQDTVCRPIFGDGAAATLVHQGPGRTYAFSFGTDGNRASAMGVWAGGARSPNYRELQADAKPSDGEFLQMNGPEIYNFTLGAVPRIIDETLTKAKLTVSDIDYFVFHQANGFMLEALRRKLDIPRERFVVDLAETGNLVSASIPVVLHRMKSSGRLHQGIRTLLCGFGVGLSWGACIAEW